MAKFPKRLVVCCAALAAAFGLTGCNETGKVEEKLESNVVSALVEKNICSQDSKFDWYGANILANKEEEDKVNVEVSGLLTTDSKNYMTNMDYVVDRSYFDNIQSAQSLEVVTAISEIVANEKFVSYDCIHIEDINKLSNTMKQVIESPLEDFHCSAGAVYSIDDIEYNTEEGYVAFTVDEKTTFQKTETKTTFGYHYNFLEEKYEWGPMIATETYTEHFTEQHKVYIRCSAQEIADMKNDANKIFENFEEKVKNNDKTNYTVSEVSVVKNTNTNINYGPDRTF